MAKNTGIPYEKVTQAIFQALLSQNDIPNVKVEQNVVLKGKVTDHQIDVYWEFNIGGIVYKTIIQAKDWNSAVKKGPLLQFKAILDDIPGQPRGIFVTSSKYQSGAIEVAKANGIIIFELSQVNEEASPINVRINSFARMRVCAKSEDGGYYPVSSITNELVAGFEKRLNPLF